MATSIDQSNYVKTALRLPPALHEAVHASAQTSGRSYNAELVELIRAGIKARDAQIAELHLRLSQLEGYLMAAQQHREQLRTRIEITDVRQALREMKRDASPDGGPQDSATLAELEKLQEASAELRAKHADAAQVVEVTRHQIAEAQAQLARRQRELDS